MRGSLRKHNSRRLAGLGQDSHDLQMQLRRNKKISTKLPFGHEKLTAVKAAIHAIDSISLAEEVLTQRLLEARNLAKQFPDTGAKMGGLMPDFSPCRKSNRKCTK